MLRPLPAKELSYFASQLYFVLDAGISVSRGIGMIKPRRRLSRLDKLLPELERGMRMGDSLHAALDKTGVFPQFFVYMAQVGEETGMLADIMRRLAGHYEKESRMSDELKSAMLYPFMVSMMMLGVIVIAMLMVVPNYARIFESNGVALPAATAALISISGFLIRYGNVIAASVTVLGLCGYYYLSTGSGVVLRHRLMLFSGIYVKSLNRKFSQALELLLVSGNDLVHSVAISKNVLDNRVMEDQLQKALDRMIRGMALSSALEDAKYFDSMLVAMVRLGEETGRLPMTAAKAADYLQRDLDTRIIRLNKLVEPVITLVLGAVLAFVMLAIMLPTFRMANIL